jgi:hypothetical protein
MTFRHVTITSQSALAGSPPSAKLVMLVASERAASPRASRTRRDVPERFDWRHVEREEVGDLDTKS